MAVLKISDILLNGRENAIPQCDLSILSGLTAREIRILVERERRSGAPICSGDAGYWLAGTPAELYETASSMTQRGYNCIRTANAMCRTAKKMLEGIGASGADE